MTTPNPTDVVMNIVLADNDEFARILEANNLVSTGNGLTPEDPLDQPDQTVGLSSRALSLLARTPLRTTAAQVLAVAASQVGVMESPPGSNNVLYDRWYGLRGPWCAMFVSWVFDQCRSDLNISTTKGFAYCPAGVEYFKANGRWSKTPQVGAIVFYQWADQDRPCHTGIVYKVGADGTIWTIEGNTSAGTAGSQSNGGMVARRHRSTTYVVGYGLPDYSAAPAPTRRDPFFYLKQPPFTGLQVRGVRHALRAAGNRHLPEGNVYDRQTADLVNLLNANHKIKDAKGNPARGTVPDTWPVLRKFVHH